VLDCCMRYKCMYICNYEWMNGSGQDEALHCKCMYVCNYEWMNGSGQDEAH